MDLNEVQIAISPSRELIPINDNLTNFHSEFKVVSKDQQPFSAIIINQTSLDSIPEDGVIEMRQAPKGIFSGEITENSGTFDHWYIAIKAETVGEAVVSIKTVEVDEASSESNEGFVSSDADSEPKKGLGIWAILIIVAVILVIGFFIVKYFFLDKSAPVALASDLPAISNEPVAVVTVAPIVDEFTIDVSDLPPI